ncbi:MAG: sugar-binding protein [Spirochaetota bacterium]
MKKVFLNILPVLVAISALHAAPQFRVDGSIVNPGVLIDMGDDGSLIVSNAKGFCWTIQAALAAGDTKILLKQLGESGLEITKSKKTALYSGTFTPPGGRSFPIEYSLTLTPENNARVTLAFKTPVPAADIFSRAALYIAIPRASLAGERIRIDGKDNAVPTERAGEKPEMLFNGAASSIAYFSDAPQQRLTLALRKADAAAVNDGLMINGTACVVLRLTPKENEIIFDIVLGEPEVERSTGESYANVDFWAADKLKMPQYKHSKNLVQNPGFEDGAKYWRFGPLGTITDMHLGEHYIVEETGFQGRRSMKIIGQKGQSPAHIVTFAIPVETDTEYTVSFYAKADRAGVRITSLPTSLVWPKFPGQASYALSTEWKRYSTTLKTPNSLISLDFGINNPAEDCAAWIDNVQFEKGPMSDYDEKPCGASFVTARRDNLFQPGEKTGAAFFVHGKPGVYTLAVRVTDLWDAVVKEDTIPCTVGEKGASIPAPWADGLKPGLYIIETTVRTEGGAAERDFDRLAIMPSLRGVPEKHKFLFNSPGDSRQANWARKAERYQHIGIGSLNQWHISPAEYRTMFEDAGILLFSSIFDQFGEVSGKWNLKHDFHRTDADLAVIEEEAYKKAKQYPDLFVWKMLNEPGGAYQDNIEEMKQVIRCMAAARKGILRANPKARMFSPDPANMYLSSGIKYIETFLAAGGKDVCDIISIHPYRTRPEDPDLDADAVSFFAVLSKYGYTGDVWWPEGIYHCNYTIPAYGLDAHKGCSADHYRTGPFSYHMGWSERMAFAYTMRSWLMSLKYADRVKVHNDWNFEDSAWIGLDMTPTAKAFAPNVLGRILGNADYAADVELGKEIRCYMYTDEKKRPVAAVWTYNAVLDTEGRPGPNMGLASIPGDVEFIDCMGNTIARPKESEIALSSFPVFLRGKPDTLASLKDALVKTKIGSGEVSPVEIYAQVTSASKVDLTARNILSRTAEGHMKLSDDSGVIFDKDISIAGKEIWKYSAILKKVPGAIAPFAVRTEFTPKGAEKPIVKDIALDILGAPKASRTITIDGDLSDWPARAVTALPARFREFAPRNMDIKQKYPAGVPWKGDADLSAKLCAAWDTEYLYLAFDVKDDVLAPSDKLPTVWAGDCVQIYFDCWADARSKSAKGYDNNDQVFDLWPSPEGLVVSRSVAPEQQLAFLKTGIVSNAKAAFKRTSDSTVYEIAIPARDIVPVNLRPDTIFGFAVIINDHDGDYRKRGLTLTPAGTEPYMRPDLYPVMVLEKE